MLRSKFAVLFTSPASSLARRSPLMISRQTISKSSCLCRFSFISALFAFQHDTFAQRVGGRVLFVLKLAVSLLRRTIDSALSGWIDSVASGFSADGDACVHCCGHILGVAVFRGR